MGKKVLDSRNSSKNQGTYNCIPCQKKKNKKGEGGGNIFLTEIRQFLAKVSAPCCNISASPPICSTRKGYHHPSTEEWHSSYYLRTIVAQLRLWHQRKIFPYNRGKAGGGEGKETHNILQLLYICLKKFKVLAMLIFIDLRFCRWEVCGCV